MTSPTLVSIGELLVEFVSHEIGCGLSRVASYSGPYPSGAPAIFIDQAARMGVKTQMIGGLGDDAFGHSLLARLTETGVGTDGITVSGDHTTGVAFVSYDPNGGRKFVFHLTDTAADHFSAPASLYDPGKAVLHVSAASLGNGRMRPIILEAVDGVVAAGGQVSFDPNARPELMGDPAVRDALARVMAASAILLPSTSDLAYLFPDLSESAAIDRLLEARADVIALKRGAAGATIVGQGARYDLPSYDVVELDPTGAGDCFGGTFVALLSQGVPLKIAGERANAAGALAVTRRGPMEGNSDPADITAFLEGAPRAVEP